MFNETDVNINVTTDNGSYIITTEMGGMPPIKLTYTHNVNENNSDEFQFTDMMIMAYTVNVTIT